MLSKDELAMLFQGSCIHREGFNLLCMTFNVNAKIEDSFDSLLGEMLKSNAETLPDILVIGLQEVVPLNAQNIIGANIFSESEEIIDRWMWLILTALSRLEGVYDQENGTVNPYELLIKEHMVGLWICVISSRSLQPAIKNVQKAQCQRGVGGMFGNKGATCVRFNVNDSSICIVNAHFAAHRGHVQQRNNDFHAILNKKMFNDPLEGLGSLFPADGDLATLQSSLGALREQLESVESELSGYQKGERDSNASNRTGAGAGADRESRLSIIVEEEDARTSRATIRNSDLDAIGDMAGGGSFSSSISPLPTIS